MKLTKHLEAESMLCFCDSAKYSYKRNLSLDKQELILRYITNTGLVQPLIQFKITVHVV